MLRRIFLLRILLGWFIAIVEKPNIGTIAKSATTASLFSNELEPITFYVDPNGNDSWSGRQKSINLTYTDGPLATIEGAKMAVRQLKSQPHQINRPIQIMLRGGTYFLSKPILFQPEDSGKINQPIVYQSYPRERAVISGGKLITGWRQETVNRRKMWTVQLPQDSSTPEKFQQLWVNGSRRSRSRYPSQGYLRIKASKNRREQNWDQGHSSLEYFSEDLSQIDPSAFKGAELVAMSRWTESRLPITKVDPIQRQIYFSKTSSLRLNPGDLYYLENSLDWLDTPGEWYLDRKQAKLYYLPLPAEDIASAEVIAPFIEFLWVFRGNAAQNKYVEHLEWRNITFSHTDWHLPPNSSSYGQNAQAVRGAVNAIALKHSTWNRCTFAHLGNYALELGEDCRYNRITNCSLFDLGAGGIKIGVRISRQKPNTLSRQNIPGGTAYNQVVGNHLYNGGRFFHGAAAIVTSKSHHNLISRNHIHDYYYTAISVMGTWSFEPTSAYQNLIEHNHIHHIGQLSNGDGPILSDMGGIYTLGRQDGTQIRHNEIHDINAVRYGGWGIYLDEGSSYIVAEHNLVYRTSHGGFAQHYGRENLIRYNIFAFGKQSQIHRHRKDLATAKEKKFISFRFENNIVYWQKGKFISGIYKNCQSHAVFTHNIYWQEDKADSLFCGLPWRKWQQGDQHSQLINSSNSNDEQNKALWKVFLHRRLE